MQNTVNAVNTNIDKTVRIFDKFLGAELVVPDNEYDAVNSYLKSILTTPLAADNLTVSIFVIAQANNIPVMTLLSELQRANGALELTSTLAFYLNNLRSNSTLLGINGSVIPNQNAARNVLA